MRASPKSLRAFSAARMDGCRSPRTSRIAPEGFDAWRETFRTIQAFEVWQTYGAWFDKHDAKLGPGIRERVAYSRP